MELEENHREGTADGNWFSASVFLRTFSRTAPEGPVFNTSRIRVDLQYVKLESGTYLDFRSVKKDFKGEHWLCII